MKVTKDQLTESLDYPWVQEELHEGESRFLWWRSPYRHHEFRICGTDQDISILFSAESDSYCLMHVAFGPWHTHIDTGSEESDLRQALKMVDQIVRGHKNLHFQRDSKGRYLRGYLEDAEAEVEPGWSRLSFEART